MEYVVNPALLAVGQRVPGREFLERARQELFPEHPFAGLGAGQQRMVVERAEVLELSEASGVPVRVFSLPVHERAWLLAPGAGGVPAFAVSSAEAVELGVGSEVPLAAARARVVEGPAAAAAAAAAAAGAGGSLGAGVVVGGLVVLAVLWALRGR